jgi:hypothetical protein
VEGFDRDLVTVLSKNLYGKTEENHENLKSSAYKARSSPLLGDLCSGSFEPLKHSAEL